MRIFSRTHWHYKNTTLLLVSIVFFVFLADTPFAQNLISSIGDWGYLGAVIIGMLTVSTFTAAPALIILYDLANQFNSIELALLAAFGSLIGDFLVFSFFKDQVYAELEPIITRLSERPFMHIFKTPYFAWLTPVVGALIIASPLPDELGITLLSANKMKKWHFIILSFVLNFIGLWLIITGAHLILE